MNTEKTRSVYNSDIIENGGYLYSGKQVYSASIATQKQTDEINLLIHNYFSNIQSFIDYGCGDGTFTYEIIKYFKITNAIGIDIANQAIKIAQKRYGNRNSHTIHFEVGNIYNLPKKIKSKRFNFGLLRGVLHHLEYPQKAIFEISQTVDSVIVLEPNGYNGILKLIERISSYHRRHGEKSYYPHSLHTWFRNAEFYPIYTKYFSIVPYFFPKYLTQLLKIIEPWIENIPFINRLYCGGVLIYYKKLANKSKRHIPRTRL
jgi:ubiquinone/menaquinone biosynthesis C-methylase UbiE